MPVDDPGDLVPDDDTGTSGVLKGTVTNDVTDLSSTLYVTLDADSSGVPVGPCVWTPRGDEYPYSGADAFVSFADDETPIVVGWR